MQFKINLYICRVETNKKTTKKSIIMETIVAEFSKKFEIKRNGKSTFRTMGATVTQKENGKVSITNKFGIGLKTDGYLLTFEINKILKDGDGFNDESFSNVKITSSQSHRELVEVLESHSKEVFVEFLKNVEEAAKKQFANREKYVANNTEKAKEIQAKKWNEKTNLDKDFLTSFLNWMNEVNEGVEKFVEKQIEGAELKYLSALNKLAQRILDEGFEVKKIQLKDTKISGNLNTTITDGRKTLTATTILAWGEVYVPHFRYLIK